MWVLTIKMMAVMLASADAGKPSGDAGGGTGSLDVRVDGVRSAAGFLRADLYAPNRHHVDRRVVPATRGMMRLRFGGLAPGGYAVMLYHDENGDRRLNTKKPFGLPSEGYGFSRNAKASFGPPKFERMRVEVRGGAVAATTATLNY